MKKSLFLSIFLSLNLLASDSGPKIQISKGCHCMLDCPYFKPGQTKGIWLAKENLGLYSEPNEASPPSGQIMAGEKGVALEGEIHVKPGELEVSFKHNSFNVGDKVYIISEDADASTWKVSHNGKEYFDDLSAMVSEKEPCKKPSEGCWAKVIRSLESQWWVKIQTKSRYVGWTKAVDSFAFDRVGSSCI